MTALPSRLLGAVLIALLGVPASASTGVPMAYFASAREEALSSVRVDPGEMTVPWFERVQLRAAADDSEQQRRAYGARLNIKTPGQYRAEKEILSLRASHDAAIARAAFSAALQQRYQLLIELYQHQQQYRLAQAQQRLAQRTVHVLRAMAGSSAFRPVALQQAELRLTVARQQAGLAERRQQRTRQRFAALLPAGSGGAAAAGQFELSEPLAVERLSSTLQQDSDENVRTHYDAALNLARLDANLAREELQRERGRSGFGLRFLELRHDSERGNAGGDYRVTIGVDLPLGRSFASSERHLRQNEAEYRMHRLHRRNRREREQLDDQFDLLIEEYRLYRERLGDIDARLARHDRSTPVVLTLELRRERLTTRGRLIALRADVYRRYIEALHLRGRLAAEPLRNWLVSGRSPS